MITLPVMMDLFRPSKLPNHMVATAPKKQPNVYAPTVMPWTLEDWVAVHPGGGLSVSIWGKYLRKEPSVKRPPRTPCDPELVGWSSCVAALVPEYYTPGRIQKGQSRCLR